MHDADRLVRTAPRAYAALQKLGHRELNPLMHHRTLRPSAGDARRLAPAATQRRLSGHPSSVFGDRTQNDLYLQSWPCRDESNATGLAPSFVRVQLGRVRFGVCLAADAPFMDRVRRADRARCGVGPGRNYATRASPAEMSPRSSPAAAVRVASRPPSRSSHACASMTSGGATSNQSPKRPPF